MNGSAPIPLPATLALLDANTGTVAVGAGALGLAAGVVGAFAVLRRRALVGDAVAHAALPGVCAAYFVVGERAFGALLLGALAFGGLAVLAINSIKAFTRVREDAATAVVLASFFGLGIVWSQAIQRSGTGNRAGLDTFLFGKAATMLAADAALAAMVAAGAWAVVGLWMVRLGGVAFDSAFLRSIGWRTGLTDALLMGLICVCTVAGLPAVGVVMMAALLVIPAVTARMWSDRLETVVALSGLFGCASAVGGALVSAGVTAGRGVPTGPMIVLLCAGVFVVSLFVSPGRGVLAVAWRRSRARREAHGPSGRAPRGGGA